MSLVSFFICILVGFFFGYLVCAVLSIGKKSDLEQEAMLWKHKYEQLYKIVK